MPGARHLSPCPSLPTATFHACLAQCLMLLVVLAQVRPVIHVGLGDGTLGVVASCLERIALGCACRGMRRVALPLIGSRCLPSRACKHSNRYGKHPAYASGKYYCQGFWKHAHLYSVLPFIKIWH